MTDYLVNYRRTRRPGIITGVNPSAGFIKTITIDHTKCGTANTSNFPMLFSGTYSYLKTVANGGEVLSDLGYDVAFYSDAACTTLLNFERVSWNAATGACEFWVQIPTLNKDTDVVIYLKYGYSSLAADAQNKTATWDDNFVLVAHMESDSSDSSVSPVTATESSIAATAGKIGGARYLDADNDYIKYTVGSGNKLDLTGNHTIEMWHWWNGSGNDYGHTICKPSVESGWSPPYLQYGWERPAGGYNNSCFSSHGNYLPFASATNVNDSTWRYIASTISGTTGQWYINAATDGAAGTTEAPGSYNTNLYIGRENATASYRVYGLKVDELRISNIARSTSYLTATYNSSNSPSTFYAIT